MDVVEDDRVLVVDEVFLEADEEEEDVFLDILLPFFELVDGDGVMEGMVVVEDESVVEVWAGGVMVTAVSGGKVD